VALTAEHVAMLRGESVATIAEATSRNAARLFRWNGMAA
jgi:Tat protein secretion system quality control protein TatD with DNase activity